MSVPVKLGAFVLGEPLASGGMGVVYRAVHESTGLRAAIKVIRKDRITDRLALDGLTSEVRAVAALDHPHIVRILDLGEVDTAVAARSGGRLFAGTPWIAMELAEGSLERRMRQLDWPEIRELLLQLLDALAHAHARGVLHLDLKPANVLIAEHPPGIRLTDFGMGVVGDARPDGEFVRGTPHFMAPEQVRGRWEDLGPWTDLYALGCVAWRVVTGRPVVGGLREAHEILRAQLERPPPTFEPRVEVPDGLEGWLRRLLEKYPDARFRFAADAARALIALDGAEPGPALPEDWRVPEALAAPEALPEAGLGLIGVREPPMVGRTAERERLWRALHDAAAGRSRIVVLRGPAGIGKSRLARWLSTRAHELGAAKVLRAEHSVERRGDEGLVGAVRRFFPVDLRDETAEEQLRARLEFRGLSSGAARDTAALLARGQVLDPMAQALGVPAWWESVADALVAVTWERPAVVWLDDVQYGEASLECLGWLFRSGRAPRAVFVLTAEDEALRLRPDAEDLLGALLGLPESEEIALGPLSGQARTALARRLLPLEPALAAQVAERSGGSPLFAIELVQDWASRGMLVPGSDGSFRLRPGASVPRGPSSLDGLWSDHLDAVLAGHPEWRGPLEVAAVLGPEVDQVEWATACAELGYVADRDLLLALLDARLAALDATTRGQRWSFVHPMLRDAVAARAGARPDALATHRACATAIGPRDPERYGLHLLRSGDAGAALAPLLEAVRSRRGAETGHREQLLRTVEVVATTHLPAADPLWRDLWDERAAVLAEQGRPAEARTYAERLLDAATRAGAPSDAFRAWRHLAKLAVELGEPDAAVEAVRGAERAAAEAGGDALAEALALECTVLREVGQSARAMDAAEWAGLLALPPHSPSEREVSFALAALQLARGRALAAHRAFERLHFSAEVTGARGWTAIAALGLGDAALALGRADRALDHHRAARRRYRALGHADEVLAQLGLVVDLLQSEQPEEAERALERARGRLTLPRHRLRFALADLLLHAGRRVDPGWAGRRRELIEALDAAGTAEPLAPWLLRLVASRTVREESARDLIAHAARLEDG